MGEIRPLLSDMLNRDDDNASVTQSLKRRSSHTGHMSFSSDEEPIESDSIHDDESTDMSFLQFFFKSSGPPQICFLSLAYAIALGSTISVVASVMIDQYAKINHGFDFGDSCANYGKDEKPQACLDGSADAQTAAALGSFFSNTICFTTSSLLGSLSDEYGRRHLILLAQFLNILCPLCLVLMQVFTTMNPGWYYVTNALGSCMSWMTLALSSISDVIPKRWRAPCFGVLLSGFSLGFALSPLLSLCLSHFGVSLFSLSTLVATLVYAFCALPETLPDETAEQARAIRRERMEQISNRSKLYILGQNLTRPFQELSILNRNNLFRLLSALAFFSGMSTTADQSLLIYYVEDRLAFGDKDISIIFLIFGFAGILVQGVVLKKVTDLVGERLVVVISFICGIITNVLYAFADSKRMIYWGIIVASFTGMSFPTISAIKSNNVEEFEQGRIQGALYGLSSLASALGPMILRFAYQLTKDSLYPGTFFLVAAIFYAAATVFAYMLPKDKANSSELETSFDDDGESDYREPLCPEQNEII